MPDLDIDRELVQQVQRGDRRAFDALMVRYQNKMVKLVGRYLSDRTEVLDVVQESFIKAYRSLPNFRGESSFYSWLYRIAVNTVKDYIQSKQTQVILSEIELTHFLEHNIQAENSKDVTSPERLLMRDEMEAALYAAVEELPDELRTTIVLRELAGLSYEEIASAIKCPIGTVRSRLSRARVAIVSKILPFMRN
jgi:RNA polymerase sigma-70 factor (ECF subfamily)